MRRITVTLVVAWAFLAGLFVGVLYRPAPRVLYKHSYPPMGYEIDGTRYTTPGDYALIVGGRVPREVKVTRDVYDAVEVGDLWESTDGK